MAPPRRGRAPRVSPPPLKRFGQHFLSDPRILSGIAGAAMLGPHDTVIEIGPGRGSLTEHLVPRAGRVIAIEIDRALAAALRERYAGDARVTVVEGDVLSQDLGALGGGRYTLAGNLPYYITTPILFHALRAPRPERIVILVQREVAERMAARPGSRAYGALSITVQAVADVELVLAVPRGAFRPPPRVDSTVVRITPRARPVIGADREEAYRTLVQAVFAQRRKQMRRIVRSITPLDAELADRLLERISIAPMARPETLSPETFARLLDALRPISPSSSARS